MLFQRRLKRGLCYLCDGGDLGNLMLPEDFTDRGMPPVGSALSVEVLSGLIALTRTMRESLDGSEGGT